MSRQSISRRNLTACVGATAAASLAPQWARAAKADTYLCLLFSDPVEGQEDAFARWNANERLASYASVPGFLDAQRFAYSDLQMRPAALRVPRHLTLLRIATADPGKAMTEIERRTLFKDGGARAPIGPALMVIYRAFRPKMSRQADTVGKGGGDTYVEIVFQDAVAGRDDAFNDWYDTIHAPELLAVPGWVSAERSIFDSVEQAAPADWPRYLVVFTIVTQDLSGSFKAAMGGGPPSPALNRATAFGYAFKALGPALTLASPR